MTTGKINVEWALKAMRVAFENDAEEFSDLLKDYGLNGEVDCSLDSYGVLIPYQFSKGSFSMQGALRFAENGQVSVATGPDTFNKIKLSSSAGLFLSTLAAGGQLLQTQLDRDTFQILEGARAVYECKNESDIDHCQISAQQNLKRILADIHEKKETARRVAAEEERAGAEKALRDKTIKEVAKQVSLATRVYQQVKTSWHLPWSDQDRVATTFTAYTAQLSTMPNQTSDEADARFDLAEKMVHTMLDTDTGAKACVDLKICTTKTEYPENSCTQEIAYYQEERLRTVRRYDCPEIEGKNVLNEFRSNPRVDQDFWWTK